MIGITRRRHPSGARRARTRLLVVAVLLIAAGGCQSEAADDLDLAQPDTLTVGSELSSPRFGANDDGEPAGFEVDVISEIARRLGLEAEVRTVAFNDLFDQVAANELDAAISAIDIDDNAGRPVVFTAPYYVAHQVLAAREGAQIAGVDDLAGQSVGVVASSPGLEYASAHLADAALVEFPSTEAVIAALLSEQVAAVVVDQLTAAEQQTTGAPIVLVERFDSGERYGIAVAEENESLLAAVDAQLAALIADGTYEQIYRRWFPGDPPEGFRATASGTVTDGAS